LVHIEPEALASYERCFDDSAAVHAMCEDYRAAASIDLEHDRADFGRRRIACPLLVLWGERGFVSRSYDVLTVWGEYADDVRGAPVPGGHFLPEESPDEVLRQLLPFLSNA
nr:alpha/beta hydrolase [Thauera sp.]